MIISPTSALWNTRIHHVPAGKRKKLHGKNALQLSALVQLGVPPIDSIRSQTVNAAELLGQPDRIGSLEPGHYADLIAVEGDPLRDIHVLERVKVVLKGGEIVSDAREKR